MYSIDYVARRMHEAFQSVYATSFARAGREYSPPAWEELPSNERRAWLEAAEAARDLMQDHHP